MRPLRATLVAVLAPVLTLAGCAEAGKGQSSDAFTGGTAVPATAPALQQNYVSVWSASGELSATL